MVEYVSLRLKTVLLNSIGKIFQFYKNDGYNIKMFLMDREFKCMRYSLPEDANLNSTVTNYHVPEIECKNCVIRESVRALISTFSFKNIPDQITIELIRFVGIWINQ